MCELRVCELRVCELWVCESASLRVCELRVCKFASVRIYDLRVCNVRGMFWAPYASLAYFVWPIWAPSLSDFRRKLRVFAWKFYWKKRNLIMEKGNFSSDSWKHWPHGNWQEWRIPSRTNCECFIGFINLLILAYWLYYQYLFMKYSQITQVVYLRSSDDMVHDNFKSFTWLRHFLCM